MQKIIIPDDIAKLILEKYKNGQNLYSIQMDTGYNRRQIKRLLADSGLKLMTKSELIRSNIPDLCNRDILYCLHYDKCMSLLDIAIKYKTNEQVIKTAFKNLKISIKSPVKAKNDKFLSKYPILANRNMLVQLYEIDKKSPKLIAKELSCSSSSVKLALKKHNIKLRNHSAASSLTRSTPKQRENARIARNLRTRFWIALSGKSKMASAVNDLGCSIDEFKEKMKVMFYNNPKDNRPMTWDNYGEWEIDHHVPFSNYDLTLAEEQKKACHYINLKPLWQKDNRVKSDNLPTILPNRVPFYIVAGPAGSGKSWVCDQLENINYISFDSIPKEQHYHYMVEYSKNGKPIIYDPFRKVSTIYNRYKDIFDMKVVLIEESDSVIYSRLKNRGSKLSIEKVKDACSYMKKYKKNAHFSGTSQEVLEYLQKELLISTV